MVRETWIAKVAGSRFIQFFIKWRKFANATTSPNYYPYMSTLAQPEIVATTERMNAPPSYAPPMDFSEQERASEPSFSGEILKEMPQEIAEDKTWFITLDARAEQIGRNSIPMDMPFYCKECRKKIIYVEMNHGEWQPVCPCIHH